MRVKADRGLAHSPAILALRRQELERWVETAIALLDEIDGDPDLEPYLADTDPSNGDCENDDADYGLADHDALDLFKQE